MSKQRNRPSLGIYFALMIILLCAYYFFYGTSRTPEITYAQVRDLFLREQVVSFVIRDGNELYLGLKDGSTVHNELGSPALFWEELGDTIRDQKDRGALADYDHRPVYTPPWWSEILLYALLIGGIFLAWQFMMIRAQGGGGGGGMDQGRRFGRARIRFGSDSEKKVSFSDVAGAEEEKEELREIVGFLKEPQKYLDLGARIPKGVLLVGPPGTGKTLLAKAVAGEAGVQFLSISGSDFVELYVGVGASRVRDLFEEAKKVAPSVVFIDEIDAVGRQRGAGLGGGHDEREQTLNQLLVEMDGFGGNSGVVVLAATNRADILDPALLRPGRFDRQIYVGSPDSKGREEILAVHTRNKPLAEDVDLKVLAQSTSGFTGADLENLVNEGALLSARRDQKFITMDVLQEAVIKVIAGPEKKSRVVSDKEKRITAYHEAGHAILFHVLPDVGPVYTVSIIPTGAGAAGYTMPLPDKDEMFLTRGQMLQDIMVSLGGRIAEEIIFKDITTGASSDIKKATKVARRMVTRFGMSENIGVICYDDDDDEVFIGRDLAHAKSHSESVSGEIDREVKSIIDGCYAKAREIILEKEKVLHSCAQLLLEKEKIGREEFEALFASGESTSAYEELNSSVFT